jgi:hypothetical protein
MDFCKVHCSPLPSILPDYFIFDETYHRNSLLIGFFGIHLTNIVNPNNQIHHIKLSNQLDFLMDLGDQPQEEEEEEWLE